MSFIINLNHKIIKVLIMPKKVSLTEIVDKISTIKSKEIKLLRDNEVIKWLFGNTNFLPEITPSKNKSNDTNKLKILEDEWGWNKYNDIIQPEKEISKKQWTTLFGQTVAREIYLIKYNNVKKPKKINNLEPDLETDDYIVEVKTQTFYTTGTAGEKILGSAFKYASVPVLFKKPLIILCLGGAEKICRHQYGNIGIKGTDEQQQMLKMWREKFNISFKAATLELLSSLEL